MSAAECVSSSLEELDDITEPLTCVSCKKTINGDTELTIVEELEAHIAVDHLGYVPYECKHCPYVFLPTEPALRLHYRQCHPNAQIRLIVNYDEKMWNDLLALLEQSIATSGES